MLFILVDIFFSLFVFYFCCFSFVFLLWYLRYFVLIVSQFSWVMVLIRVLVWHLLIRYFFSTLVNLAGFFLGLISHIQSYGFLWPIPLVIPIFFFDVVWAHNIWIISFRSVRSSWITRVDVFILHLSSTLIERFCFFSAFYLSPLSFFLSFALFFSFFLSFDLFLG